MAAGAEILYRAVLEGQRSCLPSLAGANTTMEGRGGNGGGGVEKEEGASTTGQLPTSPFLIG